MRSTTFAYALNQRSACAGSLAATISSITKCQKLPPISGASELYVCRLDTDMSLDRFFGRYAELSLGPHPEALAGLYAPTFIVGGPQGRQTFTNDVHFVEWLRQVANFNRHHGMRDLTANRDFSPEGLSASVVGDARDV